MRSLKEILIEVVEFLNKSKESDWSPLTPNEVAKNLKDQIERLEQNEIIDKHILQVEFAPTSTIQEISLINGWSMEYIQLASEFDRAIRKLN